MMFPTHIVAAGGLVLNDKSEILLVKNPRKGWEFPGGIVEPGETLPQGVMREIREEAGVSVRVVGIVGIYSNVKRKPGVNAGEEVPTIVNVDFICRYVSGELATSEESTEVGWFTREEALRLVNRKQRYRFEKALNHQDEFTCVGFHINAQDEFTVLEEYSFPADSKE